MKKNWKVYVAVGVLAAIAYFIDPKDEKNGDTETSTDNTVRHSAGPC